jgi:hypothetical protein
MSSFKFPKKLCTDMDAIVRNSGGAPKRREINILLLLHGPIFASHCVRVGLALNYLKASMKR